jgi:hypothetical protein
VTYILNRLKEKNNLIISIDEEKAVWPNSTSICDKAPSKTEQE